MTPRLASSSRRPRTPTALSALALPLLLAGCEGDIAGLEPGFEIEENAAALVTPNTVLVDAHFNTSAEGFSYFDDTFRATNKPAYASGAFVANAGFTTGAVRVRLGGVDNTTVSNMSGGYGRSFSLSEKAKITVTFRFNVTQSPNYEADEHSEVNMSVDGVMKGPIEAPTADWFARVSGDGEGGSNVSSGWISTTVELGELNAGTHTVRFGGFNNKKTASVEFTDVFIDDVKIVANPPAPPTGTIQLFSASFGSGTESFSYVDDPFRGTSKPAYASGVRSTTGGFNGSAGLTVKLGDVDNTSVLNMSGGWKRTFTLPAPATVDVSFRYNLTQSPNYEADESSEINMSIDGVMTSNVPGADWFIRLSGDVEGGPDLSTGWQSVSVPLGVLSAGNHTLVFGGFNNKKSAAIEFTTIALDDIAATATF